MFVETAMVMCVELVALIVFRRLEGLEEVSFRNIHEQKSCQYAQFAISDEEVHNEI